MIFIEGTIETSQTYRMHDGRLYTLDVDWTMNNTTREHLVLGFLRSDVNSAGVAYGPLEPIDSSSHGVNLYPGTQPRWSDSTAFGSREIWEVLALDKQDTLRARGIYLALFGELCVIEEEGIALSRDGRPLPNVASVVRRVMEGEEKS